MLGDVPLAKVVVHGEGLTIDGWASLAGQEFYVRRAVALVPGHLWVPPGGRVSVLGTSGPTIAISVDTPFAAPRSVEALSSCDLFGARDETTRAAAGPPYAIPTGRGVALRSGPRGAVVFSFAPEATSLWVWLGSQGGYTHIAGGQPPWQVALGDTPLLFDGWVTDAEVRRTDQEPGDRDSGCGITDVNDQCPCDLPLHDAPFYVAALPGAEPIGTVAKGTALSLGEQRGELVAFTTVNRVVIPPPGQQFWIRREDARRAGVVPMSDGCPACP